eukprot:m.624986 g.624986  ORF g.624986 m.624986 type:complete len:98 (+) comp22546_c0_seq19:121-414(+)
MISMHHVVSLTSSAPNTGRWCIQKGIVFIAKTERPDRMKMNLELFHFSLTPEESAKLDALTDDKTIEEFKAKYADCIVRDTPLQGDPSVIPRAYTLD